MNLATDCASCEEYDGTGEKCRQDVSEKRFCKGNWCTKIEGRIAGMGNVHVVPDL